MLILFLLGVFPSHHHLIAKFNKHFNTSCKKCLISKSSKQTVHQTQIWLTNNFNQSLLIEQVMTAQGQRNKNKGLSTHSYKT